MSEQTYQWPEVKDIHDWFGKHPTDAQTDKILELREAAHDYAADIPEGVFRAMAKQYDECTNGMLCPCGSKASYSGCCKDEWLRIKRWRKQAFQEAKDAKKAQHKNEVASAEGNTEWLIRIGYDTKDGRTKFAAMPDGPTLDKLNPHALRDAVKAVYEKIDTSIMASEIAEMVLPKVVELLQATQAQAQGRQGVNLLNPKGEPVKPS